MSTARRRNQLSFHSHSQSLTLTQSHSPILFICMFACAELISQLLHPLLSLSPRSFSFLLFFCAKPKAEKKEKLSLSVFPFRLAPFSSLFVPLALSLIKIDLLRHLCCRGNRQFRSFGRSQEISLQPNTLPMLKLHSRNWAKHQSKETVCFSNSKDWRVREVEVNSVNFSKSPEKLLEKSKKKFNSQMIAKFQKTYSRNNCLPLVNNCQILNSHLGKDSMSTCSSKLKISKLTHSIKKITLLTTAATCTLARRSSLSLFTLSAAARAAIIISLWQCFLELLSISTSAPLAFTHSPLSRPLFLAAREERRGKKSASRADRRCASVKRYKAAARPASVSLCNGCEGSSANFNTTIAPSPFSRLTSPNPQRRCHSLVLRCRLTEDFTSLLFREKTVFFASLFVFLCISSDQDEFFWSVRSIVSQLSPLLFSSLCLFSLFSQLLWTQFAFFS